MIDGKKVVTIPQTVIVHKYYYTGDRSFQAPLLKGGPTIVVFQHPETGCQAMLEVQMLPGAPRITYRREFIEYDFGEQSIRLEVGNIGLWGKVHEPRVKYRRHGRTQAEKKQAHARKVRAFFAPLTGLFRGDSLEGEKNVDKRGIVLPEANITDDLEGTIPTIR